MKIPIYQVDAFTSKVFSGNPAAVCMLDTWIDDKQLQLLKGTEATLCPAFLHPGSAYRKILLLVLPIVC